MHRRLEFEMPARPDIVFDAFHYHEWRHRWDSLVRATHVLGGAPCPFVGAVTDNAGAGLLRGLSMRTRFVSYDRPHVAAAAMIGASFPFTRWAASMRHRAIDAERSLLIYTYSFEVSPSWLRWPMARITASAFEWQTRRRFARLQNFLQTHAGDVGAWQQRQPQQRRTR
jgi:hypothetical protein